jgi:hypothetical protein
MSVSAPNDAAVVDLTSADNEESPPETWGHYFLRIIGVVAVKDGTKKVVHNMQTAAHNIKASTCTSSVMRELDDLADQATENSGQVTIDMIKKQKDTYNQRNQLV